MKRATAIEAGLGVDRQAGSLGSVGQPNSTRRAVAADRGWVKPSIPVLLLAVAMAGSASFLLDLDSHLSFVTDGWQILVGRPDWSVGTFLNPFHEQLILGLALLYKLLLAAFGMRSALPFFAVSVTAFLLAAAVLYAILRRRIGDWGALIGTVPVLFLGAASEDLLWAFQVGYFVSVAAGLGMLLALEREDNRGDRIAAALLAVSIAFSSIGIAFAAAALAQLGTRRGPRLHRVYVPLLPLLAYGVWWILWGHVAGSHLSFAHFIELPKYMFEAASAGVASLMGLEPESVNGSPPTFARALVAIIVVLGIMRFAKKREVPGGLLVALVLALAFWSLTGLDQTPGRLATSSRYQYPSAVFILLVAAEAIRGLRAPRWALWAAALVAAVAVVGGVGLTQRAYTHIWRPMAEENRTTLAAIEIAGRSSRRGFRVPVTPSGLPMGRYLAALRAHGSPAFGESELAQGTERNRRLADKTLVAALGLRLSRTVQAIQLGPCRMLAGDGSPGAGVPVGPGSFEISSAGRSVVVLRLGRFSRRPTIAVGRLPAGAARSLSLPADQSARRWRLGAAGGPARVCRVLPKAQSGYQGGR